MKVDISLRPANKSDSHAILKIYRPYIESSSISFETEIPSVAEIENRIEDYSKLSWLVYEIDGEIAGYAYASKHRTREAYRWCCEVSVYVESKFHRQNIASALYLKLFQNLREKGYVNAYAGIALPNEASEKLHKRMGFKLVGVYQKIGFKLGKWHDVSWWELRLSEPAGEPKVPII